MRRRAAAIAAGLGLVAAAAIWVPATPALAAGAPLPPCFPTSSPTASPVIPDPAGSGVWVPAVPLNLGILQLPGVNYCDPGLALPDLSSLGTIMPGAAIVQSAGQVLQQVVPDLPKLPSIPVVPGVPAPPAPIADPVLDDSAPLFTQPAAQAGAGSLSIEGLKSAGIVLVRVTDGSTIPVIRIVADVVTIDGFTLDVKPEAGGPAAVNTSDRMVLRGNAHVYLQSITATGPDGLGISLLAPTPIPGNELPTTLVQATFGLVGAYADSSDWIHTDLRMHADT